MPATFTYLDLPRPDGTPTQILVVDVTHADTGAFDERLVKPLNDTDAALMQWGEARARWYEYDANKTALLNALDENNETPPRPAKMKAYQASKAVMKEMYPEWPPAEALPPTPAEVQHA